MFFPWQPHWSFPSSLQNLLSLHLFNASLFSIAYPCVSFFTGFYRCFSVPLWKVCWGVTSKNHCRLPSTIAHKWKAPQAGKPFFCEKSRDTSGTLQQYTHNVACLTQHWPWRHCYQQTGHCKWYWISCKYPHLPHNQCAALHSCISLQSSCMRAAHSSNDLRSVRDPLRLPAPLHSLRPWQRAVRLPFFELYDPFAQPLTSAASRCAFSTAWRSGSHMKRSLTWAILFRMSAQPIPKNQCFFVAMDSTTAVALSLQHWDSSLTNFQLLSPWGNGPPKATSARWWQVRFMDRCVP